MPGSSYQNQFDQIFVSKTELAKFKEYAHAKKVAENVLFLEEIKSLILLIAKKSSRQIIVEKLTSIYAHYIASEINISAETKQNIDLDKLNVKYYLDAEKEIHNLLYLDQYDKFLDYSRKEEKQEAEPDNAALLNEFKEARGLTAKYIDDCDEKTNQRYAVDREIDAVITHKFNEVYRTIASFHDTYHDDFLEHAKEIFIWMKPFLKAFPLAWKNPIERKANQIEKIKLVAILKQYQKELNDCNARLVMSMPPQSKIFEEFPKVYNEVSDFIATMHNEIVKFLPDPIETSVLYSQNELDAQIKMIGQNIGVSRGLNATARAENRARAPTIQASSKPASRSAGAYSMRESSEPATATASAYPMQASSEPATATATASAYPMQVFSEPATATAYPMHHLMHSKSSPTLGGKPIRSRLRNMATLNYGNGEPHPPFDQEPPAKTRLD